MLILHQKHFFPKTLHGLLFLFLRTLTKCLLSYSAYLKVSHHAPSFSKNLVNMYLFWLPVSLFLYYFSFPLEHKLNKRRNPVSFGDRCIPTIQHSFRTSLAQPLSHQPFLWKAAPKPGQDVFISY